MMKSPTERRCRLPAPTTIASLLLLVAFYAPPRVAAQTSGNGTSSTWLTLTGDPPVVIARGGFSGLFPSSTLSAYQLAQLTSLEDLVLWCDVRLTKDGVGICSPSLDLKNNTNIRSIFPQGEKSYLVNGVPTQGFFPIDFTFDQLENVTLVQNIWSRTGVFDNNMLQFVSVEQVAQQLKPAGYWLNIQHGIFYTDHNLNMRTFVLGVMRRVVVNYISSPEVGFLRSIVARVRPSGTKLVLRFLGSDEVEPSTNQTYGSLLNNLTFVKTFASGILIPKNYIWPVNAKMYLLPHTSVVADAHKEGLEVYASDFTNDVPLPYNYSFDPVAEALSYIDNSQFSVDGLLTDFPITPSEAIACFANTNKSSSGQGKLEIISHNGASGDYPGSTDLAYQKAVDDGTDVIDCSVQMTADGVPVCLNSIDLLDGTNAAQTSFRTRLIKIPEIQTTAGIFSFNFSLDDIKNKKILKPAISNPFMDYYLNRNPAYSDEGSFFTLSEFLTFAKNGSVPGILLSIKNAAYLAEKEGLDVIGSVLKALNDANLNNQTGLTVIIRSADSSVLTKLKQQTRYKLMYTINEIIQDADNSTIKDIKQFADYVAIQKYSVFPQNNAFLLESTGLVDKLHAVGLSVYAYLFRNEFVSQTWDFFSDPNVEINAYFQGAGVDGIITDFPATARAYKRNSCLMLRDKAPAFMNPVQPGALLQLVVAQSLPPAAPPLPVLTESDISEPPLPAVGWRSPPSGSFAAPPSTQPSSGPQNVYISMFLSFGMLLSSSLLLSRCCIL